MAPSSLMTRKTGKAFENCRGKVDKLMICRYFCNHEICNNLEVMDHPRGVGIKFSYIKCILILNVDNPCTHLGAMLIQNKQTS